MGEVQGLFLDGQGIPSLDFDSESKGFRTFTIVGQRIFVVGGSDDAAASSLSVQIFDKSLGKWYTPSVLGTRPAASSSHSAVLLNEDRIIILKRDAPPDDSIWFLEVGTPFVREKVAALATEVVAWSKGMVGEALKPVVISGPSGVGKGTLISRLMADFPSTFGFSVSHTTRAPRDQEINGVHYHFTERSIMEKDIQDGKFLESAHVHGNLYGTSIEAVETVTDLGKRCILDIDVQGARSVKASSIEVVSIFIRPPSFEELEKRLRARGTETEKQIQKRLNNAMAELEQGMNSGIFDHILENDNLETCYLNLKKILGLDGRVNKSSSCLNGTSDKLSGEKGQKILIQLGAAEVGKAANNLFTLDLSSISGGAPGRTRGLKVTRLILLPMRLNEEQFVLDQPTIFVDGANWHLNL